MTDPFAPQRGAQRTSASTHPHTPQRTPSPSANSTSTSNLMHQSPFSDYFTDPGRSGDNDADHDCDTSPVMASASSDLPTHAQRRILRRLNSIGAQILRKEETAVDAVVDRLDKLEAAVAAVDAQSRMPADGDSGLFFPDDDDDSADEDSFENAKFRSRDFPDREVLIEHGTNKHMVDDDDSRDSPMLDSMSELGYAELRSEVSTDGRQKLVDDAHETVERICRAAAELRLRFKEVQHSNNMLTQLLSKTTSNVLSLRSENDSLRTTVSFTHSELLFLKLQLQSLEARVAPFFDTYANTKAGRVLLEGIERWELDWHDVDNRFKSNRDASFMRPKSNSEPLRSDYSDTIAPDILKNKLGDKDYHSELYDLTRPSHGRSFTAPGNVDITVMALSSLPRHNEDAGDTSSEAARDAPTEQGEEAAAEPKKEEEDGGTEEGEGSGSSEKKEESRTTKSPGRELWDDLTAYAGMDLYDEVDEDDAD